MDIPYPIKYWTFAEDGDFQLESGTKFGPITVGYETFGTLNDDKTNAVLIIHALTGDSHVTSACDGDTLTPGWWDCAVGSGKAVDTDKFFVICANVLGGCMGSTGPSSIDPKTGEPYGLRFPAITVRDMVECQKRLIDHLGIAKLHTLIGGSLGGMLVLEWNRLYPDSMCNSIVIASSYRTSSQILAFYEVGRNAILADPTFNNGDYYVSGQPARGLAIARMIAHLTYLSKDSIESKFGRDIKEQILPSDLMYNNFGVMFQIESYLRYQGRKFVERFDANSYLYITKAMDMYDITGGTNNIGEVVSGFKSRFMIISFTSDWHFSPKESMQVVNALMRRKKQVTYLNIASQYGHDSFLLENESQQEAIRNFIMYQPHKKFPTP